MDLRPGRFGPARTAAPDRLSDVERLLAYEEIRQLAARYALAVDGRDVSALVELFVPDVRALGGQVGREAPREAFERHLRSEGLNVTGCTAPDNRPGMVPLTWPGVISWQTYDFPVAQLTRPRDRIVVFLPVSPARDVFRSG
jgi:hypothetical protein